MKLNKQKKSLLFLGFIAIAAFPLQAQYVAGQYEDEAPFRTWNSFPSLSAAALGRGQTAFAWGTNATVSPANPALLVTLPKWTFSVGGSFQNATALRFGPVNSGPLAANAPLSRNLLTGDQAAVSFHAGRFAFAAAVYLSETYDRPLAERIEPYSSGNYAIRFEQTGFLRTYHLGAAFQIFSNLAAGLGLNIDSGRFDMEMFEDYFGWYQITGTKTAELSGLFLNGGLFWDLSPSVRAALTFRTPSTLEARTETVDRFRYPAAGTDISISGASDDSFDRPLVLGAGVAVQLGPSFRTMAEVTYLRWSAYRAVWLGESRVRDFRDCLRLSAGGEYLTKLRLFGKNGISPIRLGVVYDPQPGAEPRSAYFGFTVGTGLEVGRFRVDLGALYSFESGSGDGLSGRRISLDLGYIF